MESHESDGVVVIRNNYRAVQAGKSTVAFLHLNRHVLLHRLALPLPLISICLHDNNDDAFPHHAAPIVAPQGA